MAGVERFIDVGGARLWTVSEGAGPALLLINGGPGCDDYRALFYVLEGR